MRNLNDFVRALGGIHNVLSGIAGKIDLIPVPGGGGGGVDYSTTETDTGIKWIDGSEIYQIVLEISTPFQIPAGSSGYTLTDNRLTMIEQPIGGFAIGETSAYKPAVVNVDLDKPDTDKLFMASAGGMKYVHSIAIQYLKTSE